MYHITKHANRDYMNAADRGDIECVVDGTYGIYVGQVWAELFGALVSGANRVDVETLEEGPDGVGYFDAWDAIFDATFLAPDGREYGFTQGESGDIFMYALDLPSDILELI